MLFQVTAIILLLVFYGCYFGKMFLQKRQGIQTDQIGKGKTGTAKVIETLMKITTILVPLVEVICIVFNQTMLPFGARIKGALIAAVGDIVFVTSVVTMKNSWRAAVSIRLFPYAFAAVLYAIYITPPSIYDALPNKDDRYDC